MEVREPKEAMTGKRVVVGWGLERGPTLAHTGLHSEITLVCSTQGSGYESLEKLQAELTLPGT